MSTTHRDVRQAFAALLDEAGWAEGHSPGEYHLEILRPVAPRSPVRVTVFRTVNEVGGVSTPLGPGWQGLAQAWAALRAAVDVLREVKP